MEILSVITNCVYISLLAWVGLTQVKRIDKHDEEIQTILQHIATLMERTKLK